MFRTSFLAFCFGVSLLSCAQSNRPADRAPATAHALAQIDSLHAALFPDGLTETVDTARAHPYVRSIERFANAHRDHARTPELLMQAAGIANGSEWSNKAIQLWGMVWRRYPEAERAPLALFYQAFVMDTRYQDYGQAMQYYDRFLKYFPEHELVDQVKQLRQVAARGGALPAVPTPAGN